MIFYCIKLQLRTYNGYKLYFGKSQLYWKLSSLQRYDIAQNYRILHRVVQRLSQHNLKISHLVIFKN
jgi:hypothetical protein